MACLASCGLAAAPKERHALPTVPELRPAAVEEIEQAVREPGARAVLLNVWATWCGPCREEFPELVHLGRAYRPRGLRLVLVSADFADQAGAARDFLRRQGVDFTTFLKTGDDMKFIDRLEPRWTGALPATFVYDGAVACATSMKAAPPTPSSSPGAVGDERDGFSHPRGISMTLRRLLPSLALMISLVPLARARSPILRASRSVMPHPWPT